ncbi:peptide ABC transporter substrate-binding protein [Streptococcus ovis]|uniref:peptide ABC transporter substrate-binding protein n=1 Tax=Streptococcus ovis TaxID=82806 RepID=UPI0003760C94|nr:peptide ABC transporter substrate-binding protein [Streptococcus ovis]
MQKRKIVALAGVTLLSAGFLAACGNASSGKSEASSTYSYVYTEDPTSLDYLAYSRAQISDHVTNFIDGLMENDKYGNLVPSLAEDWTVSKDGLTYTYTLRDGINWYTSDGEEYAPVTAEDFVTALKHAVDVKGEGLYVVENSIKGLSDYMSGKTTDFSTVGVKAIDEKTVQYTLNQPESYWNSKLTMAVMLPLNADFLESQGKDFGKVSPDGILYNGAYLMSSMTSKSSIEYEKNPNYWDAENVKIDKIKLTFYDGQDPESLIKGFSDGDYTTARVFPNSSTFAAVKKEYGKNIRYSLQDGTVYYRVFNLNRVTYNHTAKTTDAQKESTKKALLNKDFRQSIAFAWDRKAYTAQSVGEDAAANILRNILVAPTFVSAEAKNFGQLTQEKLITYGDEWANVNLEDAQDGFYNAEKAKTEFAKAKEALVAEGVEFPIHLDVPVNQTNEVGVQQASSMKESIEKALGKENVVVDLLQMGDEEFQNVAFYTESPDQNDYDLSYAGWGPDYLDPSTYLDIFAPGGASFDKTGIAVDKDTAVIQQVGFDKYAELVKVANAENADVEARYNKYAEAQAWLTDSAIVIPYQSLGATPGVTKVVPFTGTDGWVGIKNSGSSHFKGMEVGDIVVADEYYKAREKWLEEKAKSNAKAEEELADHVEK